MFFRLSQSRRRFEKFSLIEEAGNDSSSSSSLLFPPSPLPYFIMSSFFHFRVFVVKFFLRLLIQYSICDFPPALDDLISLLLPSAQHFNSATPPPLPNADLPVMTFPFCVPKSLETLLPFAVSSHECRRRKKTAADANGIKPPARR